MTRPDRRAPKSRIVSWLGWAGLDAVSRMALMTGSTVVFTFFARAGRDAGELRRLGGQVVAQSALVTTPIFVGMAAVAPVLLPLVAGPGWDDAAQIAVCLSVASAIAVPAGLFFTAFSSQARPEFNLYSLVVDLFAVMLALTGFAWLRPISVGLSRIAGDSIRALFAIGLPMKDFDWPRRERFAALAPAWLLAGAMGASVALLHRIVATQTPIAQLAILIAAGVAIYLGLLAIFARRCAAFLLAYLPISQLRAGRPAA